MQATKHSRGERVCAVGVLTELLATRGKCLVALEPPGIFIDAAQAVYWLERDDVDAFCRTVLGYHMTPATRPLGIAEF